MQRYEIHDERLNETYIPEDALSDEEEVFTETAMTCPVCLEFERRDYPLSKFREGRIIANQRGELHCAECGESFVNVQEFATRAIDNLRDALDNQAWERGGAWPHHR